MKPEVKNALELIKSELSREEQVKALFTDKDGDVDLTKLDLRGLDVYLSELKADYIFNGNQEAKWIDNRCQTIIKTPLQKFNKIDN